jgi:hypothetical protein
MREINAEVNPQVYLGQMIRELGGHIGDFRNSLRTIEDNSFAERAKQQGPNTVVHIQASDALLMRDAATQRAIDNCFLAMVRSLLTFVDRVLGLKNATEKIITDLPVGTPVQDLKPFVEDFLNRCYREIAENHSLSTSKKVSMLQGLPQWIQDSLLSIFAVRRALEHHGGIATKEIRLLIRKTVITIGENELTDLPMYVEKGTELRVEIKEAERFFEASKKIVLDEADIENLFLTLQNLIGPAIIQTITGPATESESSE